MEWYDPISFKFVQSKKQFALKEFNRDDFTQLWNQERSDVFYF